MAPVSVRAGERANMGEGMQQQQQQQQKSLPCQ
jgi:hypothetical protein